MEDAEQLTMFNEAEDIVEEKIIEKADKITVVTHERKKHSTHKDSFENLETEEVIHEAKDKVCPECGSEMEVIGKEFIRDELVYVPARMFVRKHYVETVRCVSCGIDESRDNEREEDIPDQGSRRLSKGYEIKAVHAETMCIISHIHTLLRRF
jgi:transposase